MRSNSSFSGFARARGAPAAAGGRSSAGKRLASRLVTRSAGLGRRADWWMSRCARLVSLSFAMSRPWGVEEAPCASAACRASSS
jgi:hypothetical protein